MPEDHDWFGIPFPGTYAVGEDGLVFDKSFIAGHGLRESVNDFLQESFKVEDAERGEVQGSRTPHLEVKAWFASPTLRRAQLSVFTAEIELAAGMHVYGRPLPEGYIPIELSLDGGEDIIDVDVHYPDPLPMEFPVIGETLPAYEGKFVIKAHVTAINKDQEKPIDINATLRYQACDDRECYIPQTVTLPFSLQFLPHDWERISE